MQPGHAGVGLGGMYQIASVSAAGCSVPAEQVVELVWALRTHLITAAPLKAAQVPPLRCIPSPAMY